MSDPSIAIAEAFKQFSQATVSALRAYEQGTRARLSQTHDDLRALRRERDDALRDLNASKDQTRVWVAEVDKWKSEADRALVVNTHQAELIVQLRQESQQWKDQCLRLEETLRGEIKAWKDQFVRIDAEHTRLLSQLSSQATLAHTSERVQIPTVDSSARSSSTKRASASSSTARAGKHQGDHRPHSPTLALPRPRVVRRVQAVIEVPIKEEEVEEECCGEMPPDAGVLHHTSTPTGGGDVRRRKSSAGSRHRTEVARSDYIDEGEEALSDEASGGEYVDDEEDVENAGIGTLTARGRTMPWGRKHIRHEPDEEDDELMMYASLKDNPQKTHPPHVGIHLPRRKSVTDVTAQRPSATNVSAQKRRTTETGPGSAARAKRRR